MQTFQLDYPIKPFKVNQGWGVSNINPVTGLSIYLPFGFELHNGTDLNLVNGTPIYAPFPCEVIRVADKINGQWQPNGGGVFLSVLSTQQYSFPDGIVCYVLADFLHCESIKRPVGFEGVCGALLAKGDNTGFSTGSHCHLQLRRVITQITAPGAVNAYRFLSDTVALMNVDINKANGSFDPTPFWTGVYAQDRLGAQILQLQELLKKLLGAK